jgi:hypothetical protein
MKAGDRLHQAIAEHDLETCRQILACPDTGRDAAVHKNFRGSTPLMLAADGKCSSSNHNNNNSSSSSSSSSSIPTTTTTTATLVDLLLQAGAASSAAQKSRNGRTAADIAMARVKKGEKGASSSKAKAINIQLLAMAEKLRSLEQHAEDKEAFARCVYCKGKLRKRSKLAFLGDRVRRQEEDNALVLSLFHWNDNNNNNNSNSNSNSSSSAMMMESLERMEFHRVNSCNNFRKEITESMALLEEVRLLRNSMTDTRDSTTTDTNTTNWNDWHFIDLCSGSACVTGALLLHLMPGCFVTAVDIVGRESLPHFSQAGFGSSRSNDAIGDHTSSDQFSYVQCDIHDPGLVERLRNRVKQSTTTNSNTTAQATTRRVHVVVLAMHCCGALSLRAVDMSSALDADAAFVMPCCLPPKAKAKTKAEPQPLPKLGGLSIRVDEADATTSTPADTAMLSRTNNDEVNPATSTSNDNSSSASTSTTTIDLDLKWRGIEEEIAHIYTSRNQDEQQRRWSMLLRRYAHAKEVGANVPTGEIETTMKDIQAVLSARRTSISIFRRR